MPIGPVCRLIQLMSTGHSGFTTATVGRSGRPQRHYAHWSGMSDRATGKPARFYSCNCQAHWRTPKALFALVRSVCQYGRHISTVSTRLYVGCNGRHYRHFAHWSSVSATSADTTARFPLVVMSVSLADTNITMRIGVNCRSLRPTLQHVAGSVLVMKSCQGCAGPLSRS